MKLAQILERIAGMKISTLLMIMVGVGGFYYKNGYDSGSELEIKITELQAKLTEETGKKVKTEKAQNDAEDARKSVKKLADDFDKISKKLPSNIASVDMTRALESFVLQSGVRQIGVKPSSPVKREIYEEYPFVVQLEGNFTQIALFLYRVAKAERIAAVKEFSIARPASLGEGPLKFEATVTNYKLAEEKAAVRLDANGQPILDPAAGENQ